MDCTFPVTCRSRSACWLFISVLLLTQEEADDMWPPPSAVGRSIGHVSLGRAVPVDDGARLGVFFVALGLATTRGELSHILPSIAFKRGAAALRRNRDEVQAPIRVAERTPARRTS